MISKERFYELKSQKKKIYYFDNFFRSVHELDFSKTQNYDVCSDQFSIDECSLEIRELLAIGNDDEYYENFVCYLKNCYDTKEDAEFAKEFNHIEYVETLDLPFFDDFPESFDTSFVRFDKEMDCWVIYDLYIEFDEICILFRDITEEASDCIFREPLTKENYLEACKIAKKLFLG